jgi:hypothetical protein
LKRRTLSLWLAGATLAAGLLVVSAPARAVLGPGEAAPAFEGKEFINTEEVSLPGMRGRVVFYEIFRTW